jgi:hypothetical protein
MFFEWLPWVVAGSLAKTFALWQFIAWRRDRDRERRLRDMQERGPFVYTNSVNGVIVVVRRDDYDKASRAYEAAVKKGERKPWEKITLQVQPAFVYYTQDAARNYMHIGGPKELHELLKALVMAQGPFTEKEWDKLSRENSWLKSSVAKESPYLFVPFQTGHVPMEKQYEMFPRYYPKAVERYLVYGEEKIEGEPCQPMEPAPAA